MYKLGLFAFLQEQIVMLQKASEAALARSDVLEARLTELRRVCSAPHAFPSTVDHHNLRNCRSCLSWNLWIAQPAQKAFNLYITLLGRCKICRNTPEAPLRFYLLMLFLPIVHVYQMLMHVTPR